MRIRTLIPIPIFIGSPSDLSAERKAFREIVEKVNRIKAKSKGILLEAVGWEDTLPGKGRPQEKINEDVGNSDLVVMLLWKRWGSSTGKYSSGFEEEFEVARDSEKEIWLYFRAIPEHTLSNPNEQLKKVLEFREKIKSEKSLLFAEYENEDEWRELLVEHLCRWLDTKCVSGLIKNIPQIGKEEAQDFEDEVYLLAQSFKGQTVPGYLLNTEGNIKLPICSGGIASSTQCMAYQPDLLCKEGRNTWAIKIRRTADKNLFGQLSIFRGLGFGKAWIIVRSEVTESIRNDARRVGIYLTAGPHWIELKSYLLKSNP